MNNFTHTFYIEGCPATRGEKIHIVWKYDPYTKKDKPYPKPYTEAGSPCDLWKKAVSTAVRDYMQGKQLVGGVDIFITYRLPRPKGHYSKAKSEKAGYPVLLPSAPEKHYTKPDIDNLDKVTIDAIAKDRGPKTKDGIFKVGDQQIYQLHSLKSYGDETFIGAIITIEGTLDE